MTFATDIAADLDSVARKGERNGQLAERIRCATIAYDAALLLAPDDLRHEFALELARRIVAAEPQQDAA